MPFLREKSGRWSPEKIIAFAGRLRPGTLARLARLERRPERSTAGQ